MGPTAAAEAPLERRAARGASGAMAEHGGGRRGTRQLRREPLGTLGRVLYVLECVSSLGRFIVILKERKKEKSMKGPAAGGK